MKNLTIIIADDHPLFRQGVISIIETLPYVIKTLQATNGVEVLTLLEKNSVEVVFLDIEMPIMSGLETIVEIRRKYPSIIVIAISMTDNPSSIQHMYNNKVNAYLLKNTDTQELDKCIRLTMEGEVYYSPLIAQRLYSGLMNRTETSQYKSGDYSIREIEVLKYICEQYNSEEIGYFLNISEASVKKYRMSLMEKTKSKNLAGLVVFAIKNNIYRLQATP